MVHTLLSQSCQVILPWHQAAPVVTIHGEGEDDRLTLVSRHIHPRSETHLHTYIRVTEASTVVDVVWRNIDNLKRIPESIEISLPNDRRDGLEHFDVVFDLQQLCRRGRRQVQLVAECPAHGDECPIIGR